MDSVQRIALVFVLLIIALGGLYYGGFLTGTAPQGSSQSGGSATIKTYVNPAYGISFSYPSRYFTVESDAGTAQRGHYIIALFEDTPFNRDLVAGKIEGTEGPIGITVNLYQNNLDQVSAERWALSSNESNYKMGSGEFSKTDVGGLSGVSYLWSGLYNGKSVVVANHKFVYAFTATYDALSDITIKDFPGILASVTIK